MGSVTKHSEVHEHVDWMGPLTDGRGVDHGGWGARGGWVAAGGSRDQNLVKHLPLGKL